EGRVRVVRRLGHQVGRRAGEAGGCPGEPEEDRGGQRMSASYKDPRDVILAPVVSEKSYGLIDQGKYTFEVDPRSNKTEIKLAIEKIFGVQVASINTLNRQGKTRRTKFGMGKRKNTKRAIVTLKSGSIDIFTAVG